MHQPDKISYQIAKQAYQVEVIGLVRARNYLLGLKNHRDFFNYESFCLAHANKRTGRKALRRKGSGTAQRIEAASKAKEVRSLFQIAQLAASTSILNGLSFSFENFCSDRFVQNASSAFPSPDNHTQQELDRIATLLSRQDAFRTAELLRLFGLWSRSPASTNQLALGCGTGMNDVESIHQRCKLRLSRSGGRDMVTFGYESSRIESAVLVDSDQIHQAHYDRLAASEKNITGMVGDAEECMHSLASANHGRFNLVSVLRMEHRMIPSVKSFFGALLPLIADDCDLIFSIGLGADLNDLQDRMNLIAKMHAFLTQCGLVPVLFRMHGEGSLAQMRDSLQFGHPVLATYQLLHCKLEPAPIRAFLAS